MDDKDNDTHEVAPDRTVSVERTPEEWAERRAALKAKLAARSSVRAMEEERQSSSGSSMKGIGEGLKLASEFAAGIIVGAGIGFLIDKFAGTSPFGLIVFLMLGFAAGVRNVLRSVGPASAKPSEVPAERVRGDKKSTDS